MVSAIMTAKEAKRRYGFPDMKEIGNSIQLRNTDGRRVVVSSSQEVYMRGKGNFGIYGELRDTHRKSTGYDPGVSRGKIGDGDHRHEMDITNNSRERRPKLLY